MGGGLEVLQRFQVWPQLKQEILEVEMIPWNYLGRSGGEYPRGKSDPCLAGISTSRAETSTFLQEGSSGIRTRRAETSTLLQEGSSELTSGTETHLAHSP